jgi:5'-methylthioadenosine phosphorylase
MFLPRHGYGHTIPPHMVNYRANLWALHHHKATGVISVASVGGIRGDLEPGDIVLPHQIIDYTWGRKSTYFDGVGTPVTHIDFTEPYDRELGRRIREAGEQLGVEMKVGGVYAATQGPRLETAAEINRLERDGADLVGMTGMPEAALARELGLPYAAINVIANHAAGRGSSANGIHFESLEVVLQEAMGRVRHHPETPGRLSGMTGQLVDCPQREPAVLNLQPLHQFFRDGCGCRFPAGRRR